ncbi:MAG: hypothetical protein J5887_04870, partial [Erysipelotrichaceae bacterium]|nr:hypothetical protein [Erysipelotrichaceae bacterium]
MSSRFPYGKDTEAYLEKALEIMKDTYPWASRDLFRSEYSYAVEKEEGKEVFVSYYKWSDGDVRREVRDVSGEEFIDSVISDHRWAIEIANPAKTVFKVPYAGPVNLNGWYLERYEFRTHQLGGYSSFVQAGDRSAGASREFFLPPRFFAGSWSDFLDQYCELVPGYAFGLDREQLEETNGLKSFLGFSDLVSPKVWNYILAHNVDDLFLFADWNEFLELLYGQGGQVSAIRFYDHCLWENR